MMDQSAIAAQTTSVDALFRSARLLLRRGGELDAVQVLHLEIARSLGTSFPIAVPAHYTSLRMARRSHDQLFSAWKRVTARGAVANPLFKFWDERPAWFSSAAMAVLLVVLTLRYVLVVTYGKNWAKQNPEGHWISRFYRNGTFEGYPLLRYDVGVNADFGEGGPADAVKADFFSARWDTCLVVTKEVVVLLELDSDDSSKLFLDEELEFEVTPGPGHNSALVALHPGLRQVRVDFNERAGAAMVRLSGFDSEGTEAYSFRRPTIEGTDLRCR